MSGMASVMRGDDLRELFRRHSSAADLKECADNGPNHIAQKPVGGNDENGLGAGFPYPMRFADVTDGRLDVRVRTAERGKILSAEQLSGSIVHGVEIQSGSHSRIGGTEERILACGDPVMICARRGVKACVGVVSDRTDVTDGDGVRKQSVKPSVKIGGQSLRPIKMRNHLFCMHARIGPAGKRQRHRFTQNSCESRFQLRLYRVSVRLRLRTVEIRTSICKRYEITHGY